MTSTATEPGQLDLLSYEGRKVRVFIKDKDPVEGLVEAANPDMGLLIKIKGKSSAVLVLTFEIEKIEIDDTKEQLSASKVKPVKLERVRRHLLSAHGFTVSRVNGLTDEQAMTVHDEEHRKNPDLGHVHVDPSKADKADKENKDDGDDGDDGDDASE